MAVKKAATKTYSVYAKFPELYTSVNVHATSMEDALEIAKTLEMKNFITFEGEWIDGRVHIAGVNEND